MAPAWTGELSRVVVSGMCSSKTNPKRCFRFVRNRRLKARPQRRVPDFSRKVVQKSHSATIMRFASAKESTH
jgi:hypothetical protein